MITIFTRKILILLKIYYIVYIVEYLQIWFKYFLVRQNNLLNRPQYTKDDFHMNNKGKGVVWDVLSGTLEIFASECSDNSFASFNTINETSYSSLTTDEEDIAVLGRDLCLQICTNYFMLQWEEIRAGFILIQWTERTINFNFRRVTRSVYSFYS